MITLYSPSALPGSVQFNRWCVIALAVAVLMTSAAKVLAAADQPVVTLTPGQEKSLDEMYFNCDHEGQVGCLELACKKARLARQDAAEVQYLYRGASQDFPELITPTLRACFVRAGGRFR